MFLSIMRAGVAIGAAVAAAAAAAHQSVFKVAQEDFSLLFKPERLVDRFSHFPVRPVFASALNFSKVQHVSDDSIHEILDSK